MEIFIAILLVVVGIALIVKGGDFFVDSASWMAEVSGLPPVLIGATIVSVATTLPELIVSIIATARGSVEIAVGNAVGSVVANLGLIMAISLICMPGKVNRKEYLFKSVVLLVAVSNLLLVCVGGPIVGNTHTLNVWSALVVFELFFVFVIENVLEALKAMKSPLTAESTGATVKMTAEADGAVLNLDAEEGEAVEVKKDKKTIIINILKFIGGAGGVVGGAELLVIYGQKLALLAGVPEGVIAVTLVAIGTSLPELVTTISAVIKKKASISVGNIIGANILDITMILPICAMVSGGSLIVPREALILDMPFCLGLSAVGILPMLITKKFYRWQGIALLVIYGAYIALRVILT